MWISEHERRNFIADQGPLSRGELRRLSRPVSVDYFRLMGSILHDHGPDWYRRHAGSLRRRWEQFRLGDRNHYAE
jgi:hypothetical protein